MSSENQLYVPESAMVIMAHPDDIEFSCAGTIARWTKSGCRVVYVLCTSGDVGIADDGITRTMAMETREKEQREAARICGVPEVVFLREPDGMLEPSLALRKKLVREIRRHRPEVLICGDPTVLWAGPNYINHPDHRAAATAAVDAVFPAAGQPNLFEELEEEDLTAHKTRKVYVSGWTESDIYVNIESTIEQKIEALRAHQSQMKDWDPAPRIKEWASGIGKGKEMAYAESFRVITLESDADWEKWKGVVVGRSNGKPDRRE
jgi:LmbE family N-acetylglucosaminyl deacetylase